MTIEEIRKSTEFQVFDRKSSARSQGENPRPSTLILTLKWMFWILLAGIVLIVILRFGRLLK